MILVDSDVLIAHLRGHEAAKTWLRHERQTGGPMAASVVTVVEVGGGMRSPERREVTRLFASLHILSVSERIAWRAAELMRAHRRAHSRIGLGDYLIAATADVEGLVLATLNMRHYPMFPGLAAPFVL